MEISRKERIEVLKECLQVIDRDKDGKRITALQSAIAEAELMERMASGGVEKKAVGNCFDCRTNKQNGYNQICPACREKIAFNEAIDLCNAHWAEKIGGILEVIMKEECCPDIECVSCNRLADIITTHLTAK